MSDIAISNPSYAEASGGEPTASSQNAASAKDSSREGALNTTSREGAGNMTADAERGVFALLALIQDPVGFAERLKQFTTAREEATRQLDAAQAQAADLAVRERATTALKVQAEEALAVYRRELDDLARKREEVERTQSDLYQARAKMEADAADAKREVMIKSAALKTITDGLEERERLAKQVFEQGTALQHDYAAKMAQLKSLASAG
jgi:chromosome segregation ATPase